MKRNRLSISALSFLLPLTLLSCNGDAGEGEGADTADEHVEAMEHEHAGDSPSGNEVAWLEPAVEVTGEEVTYRTIDPDETPGQEVEGREVSGYLAAPADAGDKELPAIIVIHEWWGLNDNVRAMTRRLAGEGYRVLAIDMYGGEVAETPEDAGRLAKEARGNQVKALETIEAGIHYLQSLNTSKLGVIGWCFGGGFSLQSALTFGVPLDAAVMYYGDVVTDPAQLKGLEIPLLGIFGAEDTGIPVEDVRRMKEVLDSLGKEATIEIYPNAEHAFANPSGDRYNAEAAVDAWEKTAAFLRRELGE